MSLKHTFKERIWWPIKHRLFHPHANFRAAVFPPKNQCIEDIVVNFHMETLIEVVNTRGCFDDIDYLKDKTPAFTAELRECYEYALIGRSVLLSKINAGWRDLPSDPCVPDYATVLGLETELHRYDSEVCAWVVANRTKLYT